MGELENRPPDPSLMRISDADRQRVADVLRDAAGEGRIDLDELEERLELTWGAKTYADLVPITSDLHLPTHPQPAATPVPRPPSGVPAVGHNSSVGEFGQGKDRVPAELGPGSPSIRVRGMALMGSVTVQRLPAPGTPRKYLGTY